MPAAAAPTIVSLQAAIASRAAKDPAFKKEFFADPKAAIEKYSNQKLPADVKVFAHTANAKEMHLVIPDASVIANAQKAQASAELSDADLEKVAGGEFVVTIAIVSAVMATVSAGISVANDQTQRRHGW